METNEYILKCFGGIRKMNKKTVLHILNTGEYSGAENVAITIIKNYPNYLQGIYMSRNGSISEILANEKICYYGVDKLSIQEIRKAIKKYQPNLIHAHDFTASLLAATATMSIPVISHLHNNVPWMRRVTLRSLLYRLAIKKYDKILTVSDAVIKECWYCAKLKKKAICIGNPIDLKRILEKKQSKIETKLLFIGRLSEQKNPIEFLNIIKNLTELGLPISATMLGRGELEDTCKQYVRENHLQQIVQMKGFVDSPYDYLNYGSILVLPSEWEGYGLVVVEAFAFGVPVVANPVGGIATLVNSDCGYLSSKRSDKENEIKKLVLDPQYYDMKSKNAKKRAEELENMEKYMSMLETIYQNAIEPLK